MLAYSTKIICRKLFDFFYKSAYNKYRKWRNHKRGLPQIKWFKTHLTRESLQMCFYWLFALTK